MEILALFIVAFLFLRTLVSMVNAFSYLHLPNQKPDSFPKVSVLIPARNEEATIGKLLESLEKQDYPDFEVIVCNDHSSDNTEEILNWFSGENQQFHWFLGEKLRDNWLGKNFACHQLAQKATGSIFIFVDADVALEKDTLTKTVAYFLKKKLTLLSVFPQQKMKTFSEHVTVPLMNWILQSLLPMVLVQKVHFASLSAANGQFMVFEAANYRTNQWHSRVRNQNVEDIRIARMIKSEGYKMAVLLGKNDIYCRMYQRFGEAVHGFSRNIHEYFGGSRLAMMGYLLVVLSGPFIVFLAPGYRYFLGFIALVLINRVAVSVANKQNMVWNILLHPLQMTSFAIIALYNIFRKTKRKTTWKGRSLDF